MGKFSASVKNWTEKAKRNSAMVFRSSVQKLNRDLMTEVGSTRGLTPIDTGNLRNSLMASTSYMPRVKVEAGAKYPWKDNDPTGDINLVIQGAEIGDTIYLGFQAAYARRMEYGFTGEDSKGRSYNQQGRYYVRGRAEKWKQYVNEAAKEIGE